MINTARILILEDDASLRELLVSVLQDEGFDAEAAAGGEEAVEIASRKLFDLVILDIRMEGMDGLEAFSLMRSSLEEAAALVITGYASEEDSIRALRLGAADYLRKPFELNIFLDKVSELVELTRSRRRKTALIKDLQTLFSWSVEALSMSFSGDIFNESSVKSAVSASQKAKRLAYAAGISNLDIQLTEIGTALKLISILRASQKLPQIKLSSNYEIINDIFSDNNSLPSQISAAALQEIFNADSTKDGSKWMLSDEYACCADQNTDLFKTALDALEYSDSDLSSAALYISEMLWNCGRSEKACDLFKKLAESGSSAVKSRAMVSLAGICLHNNQPQEAELYLEKALKESQLSGPSFYSQTALAIGIELKLSGMAGSRIYIDEAFNTLKRLKTEPQLSYAFIAKYAPDPSHIEEYAQCFKIISAFEDSRNLSWLLEFSAEILNKTDIKSLKYEELNSSLLEVLVKNHRSAANLICSRRLSSKASKTICAFIEKNQSEFPYHTIQKLPVKIKKAPFKRAFACRNDYKFYIMTMGQAFVRTDEEPLDGRFWVTSKIKLLFIRLALSRAAVSISQIIEEFWPNAGRSELSLYKAVSSIRHILKPYLSDLDPVIRINDSLQLNPKLNLWIDASEIEGFWKEYQRNSDIQLLHSIMQLSGGPFIPGLENEWADSKRLRLSYICLEAASKIGSISLEKQDLRQALEMGHACLQYDPLSESGCELLMKAHLASHNAKSAVKEYCQFKTKLKLELDTEPSQSLTALYEKAKNIYE